jgi:hypothetical protein
MKKREKKDWEKEIESCVEAILNRPVYKKLTEDILSSIPDDALEQVVIDNIQSKMRPDYRDEYEVVTRLSKGMVLAQKFIHLKARE